MLEKVKPLLDEFAEVEKVLAEPEIFNDQKRYREISQRHAYLADVKEIWDELESVRKQLKDNSALLKEESDPSFAEMLRQDIEELEGREEKLGVSLRDLLIPPDPDDHRNTILELRAGTGGDEAALFVGDCVRMYRFYATAKHLKVEQLSASESEAGGYKECILVFSGKNAHRLLQYEGGTHRVQRVPETEAQGRIHTSTITIAVLLEPEEEGEIDLDPKDLRIDTMRASGAGGQHVNTTDSAVRITHLPSGLVATCQDEKSQHKNRDKAMRHLKAMLLELQRRKAAEEQASKRLAQVGTGERSERIRTYNFPQNRVTDHRINLTKYHLDRIMEGELDEIIQPLVLHFSER
ncbi:MAG: peptide chain release factor 1 [Parachlamydiales bacterium]